ncbi:MAG: alpha-ketoglutarate-dependent dioxygenase AlkB [Rubrivivax sp.]
MTSVIDTAQRGLFGAVDDRLPPGLQFAADLVGPDEERALLAVLRTLPLQPARYHGYLARRRVFAWRAADDGGGADDDHRPREAGASERTPATSSGLGASLAELPPPLVRLRTRLARWAGIDEVDFVHAMVSEYTPGAPLGWHRDAPHYEHIVGVSLASAARLRWRPWPHDRGADAGPPARSSIVTLELPPRSAYAMQGPARWGWQHSLAPVAALRYSITMRTARRRD